MSNPELNYFAFDDNENNPIAPIEGQPLPPPDDVARLVEGLSLPELPLRRPYTEEIDKLMISEGEYKTIDIQKVGETIPKPHSDGTVRIYVSENSDRPGLGVFSFVADRDDYTRSPLCHSADIMRLRVKQVKSLGGGDIELGLGILTKWLSESKPNEDNKHGYMGYLSSVHTLYLEAVGQPSEYRSIPGGSI